MQLCILIDGIEREVVLPDNVEAHLCAEAHRHSAAHVMQGKRLVLQNCLADFADVLIGDAASMQSSLTKKSSCVY